jgi:hypothetical protein
MIATDQAESQDTGSLAAAGGERTWACAQMKVQVLGHVHFSVLAASKVTGSKKNHSRGVVLAEPLLNADGL